MLRRYNEGATGDSITIMQDLHLYIDLLKKSFPLYFDYVNLRIAPFKFIGKIIILMINNNNNIIFLT